MGQVLTAGYYDWLAVAGNLRKDRKICMWMTRIMVREGLDLRISGIVLKAVEQAVLLFGSETWVLTPSIERYLGRFKHRVARQITWRQTRR